MPSQFSFDPANRILYWSLEGRVTDELYAAESRRMEEAFGRTNAASGIVDLSGLTEFRLSVRFLEQLASATPIFPSEITRIIIAPTRYMFGMARIFESLSERTRPNTHVVSTMNEALVILRIPALDLQPLVFDNA